METFFQNHAYMLEHTNLPVRRALMDSIDWSYRLIGIRGPRGVGRTSFLLQYAKEHFDVRLRQCLYINCNSFYFQGRGVVEFAGNFVAQGGLVLLMDQAFKLSDWRQQLCECYHKYPRLRIVYTTTSVPQEGADDDELSRLARTYVLHGFSFREYVNLQTGNDFRAYSIEELLNNHEQILKTILPKVRPWQYFQEYLHHGYFPFFLESRNFTEALLKAMNNMIEVDVLFTKSVAGNNFTVSDIKTGKKTKNPAPPFTTSTLQQEASRKLNFQSQRTMRVAQELYEGINLGSDGGVQGLITYMRTDSLRISAEAQNAARDYIVEKYGDKYCPENPRVYKSKASAQDAHEAIRPSSLKHDPQKVKKHLSTDQYRLYKLIWDRFIASQMEGAELAT
ncbi:MAG: AAA family ATPase, partial [Bacteroidaceae bacterium]|nr:AAA family ATPase [Bacteroidaceae bacterium]